MGEDPLDDDGVIDRGHQHFFALKLTKDDVVKGLNALKNASVVTDVQNTPSVANREAVAHDDTLFER